MTTEQQIQPYPPQSDDEITLREVILKVKEYWAEIRRKWYIILLFCIPTTAWQVYKYFKTPITYPAVLTFMVNEDQGLGGLSAVSGLLGSFGLGGGGESNYDRILALARSTRILRESILTKVTIDGKEDYLGNHFIRIQRLNEEKWKKAPKSPEIWLKDFQFTHANFEKFDLKEQTAVKRVIDFIIGAKGIIGVFGASLDKKTGIMSLSASCRSEEMTIMLLNTIFDKLSSFYIEKSTEKNQGTYDIVRTKADSLRRAIGANENRLAGFEDQARGLIQNTNRLPAERFTRDKQTQLMAYGEALKNLEMADFALKSNTPYVQVIDEPFAPIKREQYRKLLVLIFGPFLGIMLGALYVVFGKAIEKSM
jgi:hypothetical protein